MNYKEHLSSPVGRLFIHLLAPTGSVILVILVGIVFESLSCWLNHREFSITTIGLFSIIALFSFGKWWGRSFLTACRESLVRRRLASGDFRQLVGEIRFNDSRAPTFCGEIIDITDTGCLIGLPDNVDNPSTVLLEASENCSGCFRCSFFDGQMVRTVEEAHVLKGQSKKILEATVEIRPR